MYLLTFAFDVHKIKVNVHKIKVNVHKIKVRFIKSKLMFIKSKLMFIKSKLMFMEQTQKSIAVQRWDLRCVFGTGYRSVIQNAHFKS